MKNRIKKGRHQFTLRLSKKESERFSKLKSVGGHRKEVDVVYTALNERYTQLFNKPFFD